MSMWTYVHGAIEVDTFADSSGMALSKACSVIESLPKVTGSERNMNVYVNLIEGHNNYAGGRNWSREWQTKVLISIEGSLRDRDIEHTLGEVTSFLNRLSKRLQIDYCSCTVRDGYNKKVDAVGNWRIYRQTLIGTAMNFRRIRR